MVEHADRWVLPFRGFAVTKVEADWAFGLTFDDQGAVRISSTMTLGWAATAARSETARLKPECQDVAAGLALFNATVLSAVASKSGGLRIVFDDGHRLAVAPDSDYEAWTATGPSGMLIVSRPGGDLAVWTSQP
ncbi:DUF6188 family protein [Actinocatenispora thailandica]|uniref:DUF6188 family protein n=1 Tax=Actinocatenispora thailandica TaxID=227318 RepID=UPI00194F6A83|nr:DUF6188 family protein [Actinocatenispora thailandica]